ncbi:hypothetical protein PROFUN_08790 [Planoprotostelium fungivorum]|uniref:Uncharacterized protein n=1 Tax=Planoprotostelium fungivorum TaxID=1890364 RepID=A0A2P6MVX1_9EUKA|nr:hypothetical protein PROFUN_08790 [Planoprotostelium fungivorum]
MKPENLEKSAVRLLAELYGNVESHVSESYACLMNARNIPDKGEVSFEAEQHINNKTRNTNEVATGSEASSKQKETSVHLIHRSSKPCHLSIGYKSEGRCCCCDACSHPANDGTVILYKPRGNTQALEDKSLSSSSAQQLNTSVVDVVRPAQAPNMAPSAVAQPPIILTEKDLLLQRQVGNILALSRGTELLSKQPRREPFHFCLFCSLTRLSSQAETTNVIKVSHPLSSPCTREDASHPPLSARFVMPGQRKLDVSVVDVVQIVICGVRLITHIDTRLVSEKHPVYDPRVKITHRSIVHTPDRAIDSQPHFYEHIQRQSVRINGSWKK